MLKRALGTKPSSQMMSRTDALLCPADMKAAGMRPRKARECLQ